MSSIKQIQQFFLQKSHLLKESCQSRNKDFLLNYKSSVFLHYLFIYLLFYIFYYTKV